MYTKSHPTELLTKVLTFRKSSLPVFTVVDFIIMYIYKIYIFISCRLDILRFDLINFFGHFSIPSYIAILTLVQTQPKLGWDTFRQGYLGSLKIQNNLINICFPVFLIFLYSYILHYSIFLGKIHAWNILT